MAACQCYRTDFDQSEPLCEAREMVACIVPTGATNRIPISGETPKGTPRGKLFNRVTVLLLTIWVGIVATAFELAVTDTTSARPTLDVFIRSLF